jgi:RNA polymerase sigma factor (sigma-70 family)
MPSDKEFLEQLKAHDRIIHKVCRLYQDDPNDRQDLFQEIVCQAWRSYASFRSESRFPTWLYRVALNTAISFYRRQRSRREADPGDIAMRLHPPDDPYASQVEVMYAAINRLSRIDKAIVLLYLEDCSYDEMASVMGMSKVNIGVRLNRIRKRLREDCERAEKKDEPWNSIR